MAKADLIEYIIEHGDEERPGRFRTATLMSGNNILIDVISLHQTLYYIV